MAEKKKTERKPKRTQVFREGSTGPPPSAILKKGGHERGFPTKSEFKQLFKIEQRLVSHTPELKGYEFASAAEFPKGEVHEWVQAQVSEHSFIKGDALGVWCMLPKSRNAAQDAVPLPDTIFTLWTQKEPINKVMNAVVLQSSERLTRHERGVCFLVIGNADERC